MDRRLTMPTANQENPQDVADAYRRSQACGADPRRSSSSDDTVTHDPISIVDDDEAIADSLSVALQAHGFDVLAYGSGSEFLANRGHDPIGCLVIDQHMPGMTGTDVVAALRREGQVVPVILITGRPDAVIAERAAKLGLVAVLQKPFAFANLITLIRSAQSGRV